MNHSQGNRNLTRRRLLQGSAAMAASAFLSSCSGASSSSQTTPPPPPPTNPQPVPSSPITTASLAVTASTTSGSIGPRFLGFSLPKSTLYSQNVSTANTDMMAMFNLLPAGIIRVNGTECLSCANWTPTGVGSKQYQIAPSDVTRYAAFLQATGWQALYGINMSNYYDSSLAPAVDIQTVANAVNEAQYVAGALGSSLYGIEIGNEPEQYYRQTDSSTGYMANLPHGTSYSVTDYEATWILFYNGIHAALPNVPLVGPGTGLIPTWAAPFATYAGTKLSSLTIHYYRDYLQSSSDTALWLVGYPDPNLVQNSAQTETAVKAASIPWRLDEGNSSDNDTLAGIADGFGSALWALDTLFTIALNGGTGMNFMTGNALYTGDYSPFAYLDPGSGVSLVRPEFYGLVLFGMVGEGNLYPATLSGIGSLNISAFAVKTSTGLNLIIVNKDPAQNLQLTINLPKNVNTATLLALTSVSESSQPSLNTTCAVNTPCGVTIQGSNIGVNGSFTPGEPYGLSFSGSQVSCYVPYTSAVLIQTT